MKYRKLGNGVLEVSALGMGCMNLSFGTGPARDINDGVAVIRRANAVHPVAAVQNQYSIWTREPEARYCQPV
ncbi:hypothetical protein [Mucilaginibacter sp. SP1R1]|uniref:hypothetical protein n=1 Tax=Mucilaginibacter sp. SP1R1 TaxID=2723091 RepID=UPI00178E6963|nr:hypothetical protein [Mucilaginibacter sp. SP1R1]MBB6149387.1 aryl-alcohol dehydrogenase-like predicted oxidoreductase [Mucilaginibacter sp. SP1R1]